MNGLSLPNRYKWLVYVYSVIYLSVYLFTILSLIYPPTYLSTHLFTCKQLNKPNKMLNNVKYIGQTCYIYMYCVRTKT